MEKKAVEMRKEKSMLNCRLSRKGEGMKREDGKAIGLWVDMETAKRIDRIAKKVGISKSSLARNLVMVGLEDAEILDKLGILSLGLLIMRTKEHLGQLIEEGKRQIAEA